MDTRYVIRYWHDGEPTGTFIVSKREMLKRLDDAHQHDKSITVHELGFCLIDWSYRDGEDAE